MRRMPQTVCHTRGTSTIAQVMPWAMGCGYSVTAVCQAAPLSNAARLFQRWNMVHTPRGRMASAEPRRSLMKLAWAETSALLLCAAVLTTWESYHRLGEKRHPLDGREPGARR